MQEMNCKKGKLSKAAANDAGFPMAFLGWGIPQETTDIIIL